jgi:phosphotriesterase-related protein
MVSVETVRGPALREQGVTDEQVRTMLVDNPRRYVTPGKG